jgi:predicted  nucleic acid-binding Zn-ribbon protein
VVHPDVTALLALQADDAAILELEERLAALEPRTKALDEARRKALDAAQRSRSAVDDEEKRRRDLYTRITQHKQLHERNLAQLDAVKKVKEATAAMSQVEQARRILADEESELATLSRRITELTTVRDTHESALKDLDHRHAEDRASIETQRAEIDTALTTARAARSDKAAGVDRPLLAKYDRIRGARKRGALFSLRGPSCGNCDTTVPMQRRNLMAARGNIEVCETCGVLLYADVASEEGAA